MPACAMCGPTCATSATWSSPSRSPATPWSSCRRSSTSRTPGRSSSTSSPCSGRAASSSSRPPTCSPWLRRGLRSPTTPGTSRSTARRSSASSASRTSSGSSCSASSTPASCASTRSRSGSDGTRSTSASASPSASTTASPRRSRPPTSASAARASARRWTSSPSVMHDRASGAPAGDTAGDLAIVLHSHMPYVEGFGTYPFGEEWLFDAVIRSYLPLLEFAERLTMTVTPVLADQLEDAGAAERLRRFLVEWRIGAAAADLEQVPEDCRAACEGEQRRYEHALELLDAAGGDPLAPFQRAAAEGRVALASSSATHAVLPLLATRQGLGLQLDAGIRSHRRRFGWDGGFWLPECAYAPGLEWRLAEAGVGWFCTDQSAHAAPLDALAPIRT